MLGLSARLIIALTYNSHTQTILIESAVLILVNAFCPQVTFKENKQFQEI